MLPVRDVVREFSGLKHLLIKRSEPLEIVGTSGMFFRHGMKASVRVMSAMLSAASRIVL